jgi:hypothetical protein
MDAWVCFTKPVGSRNSLSINVLATTAVGGNQLTGVRPLARCPRIAAGSGSAVGALTVLRALRRHPVSARKYGLIPWVSTMPFASIQRQSEKPGPSPDGPARDV